MSPLTNMELILSGVSVFNTGSCSRGTINSTLLKSIFEFHFWLRRECYSGYGWEAGLGLDLGLELLTQIHTTHTHTHTHTTSLIPIWQLRMWTNCNPCPASADTQLGQMILILTLTITLAQKIRKKPDSRLTILAKSIVSGGKNVTPVIWSHIKTTSLAWPPDVHTTSITHIWSHERGQTKYGTGVAYWGLRLRIKVRGRDWKQS